MYDRHSAQYYGNPELPVINYPTYQSRNAQGLAGTQPLYSTVDSIDLRVNPSPLNAMHETQAMTTSRKGISNMKKSGSNFETFGPRPFSVQEESTTILESQGKIIQPQNLTIHQNNLNINLGKHLPNSVKDLGLSKDFKGYSEKEMMDIYVKNLNLQTENTELKERTKQDGIEITRLKREIKKRDRLISQYIPESIYLLF